MKDLGKANFVHLSNYTQMFISPLKIHKIFLFTQLLFTELHLNNNHLSSLPDELRQMEGLTLLDISHNAFTALPPAIYRVDSLKILSAQSNSIKGEIIDLDIWYSYLFSH